MSETVKSRRSAQPVAGTYRVGFLLVPEFPMMAFAAAVEPLRAANRLSGRRVVRVAPLLARRPAGAGEQRHRRCRARRRRPVPPPSICCSFAQERTRRAVTARPCDGCAPPAARVLRWAASVSAPISLPKRASSTGGGARCIGRISPRSANALRACARRPTSSRSTATRYTCSGGTAALDMMLSIVSARDGRALANDGVGTIHPSAHPRHARFAAHGGAKPARRSRTSDSSRQST